MAAFHGSAAIGAAWVRLFADAAPPAAPSVPELAIAVDAQRRRAGVGSALLERLLAVLTTRGHAFVDLSVAGENEVARRLYQRFGFVEVHRAEDGRSWMRRPVG